MNFQKDLLSVVVPTYNQREYVAACMDSILCQSYSNLEIICVDDCSQDGTLDILLEYQNRDSRVNVISSDKNLGISKNFNRGFDVCSGEYVAFICGDDWMFPGKLSKQIEILKENPMVVQVMHDMEMFNWSTQKGEGLSSDNGRFAKHPLEWGFYADWSQKDHVAGVIPSSICARSDYYLQSRYPEEFKYKHEIIFSFENYAANPEGQWYYIDEVLGSYGVHDNNFSMQTENRHLVLQETEAMVEMLSEKYPQHARIVNEYLQYFYFRHLVGRWGDEATLSAIQEKFNIHATFAQRWKLAMAKFKRMFI